MSKLGYQSLDIGHLDIEYEWYLRKSLDRVSIENKYVNEAKGSKYLYTKKNYFDYYSQIIGNITLS